MRASSVVTVAKDVATKSMINGFEVIERGRSVFEADRFIQWKDNSHLVQRSMCEEVNIDPLPPLSDALHRAAVVDAHILKVAVSLALGAEALSGLVRRWGGIP